MHKRSNYVARSIFPSHLVASTSSAYCLTFDRCILIIENSIINLYTVDVVFFFLYFPSFVLVVTIHFMSSI